MWSPGTDPISLVRTYYPGIYTFFHCIPFFLPRSFFKSVDSIISTFIWAGKNLRIGKAYLQWSRSSGGLGVPNLLGYYWAANMHKLLLWFTSPQSGWCELEINLCVSSSPQALACGTLPFSSSQFTTNPIVTATLKIWAQIRKHFNWFTIPRANSHL